MLQWKHVRDQWKFEKIKQIWLMDNIFNEKYIPDQHFQVVLEYFENCKGMAKKKLVDKAMTIIKEAEDDEELSESEKYKRARQLLQALPTES